MVSPVTNLTIVDSGWEKFLFIYFYSIGTVSALVSFLTFYLILFKSFFFNRETRFLILHLQVSTFLNNFHLTLLFAPSIYPRSGGGYCVGLLSMVTRFHILMTLFVLFNVIFAGSLVVLIFGRHQSLLLSDSFFHIRQKGRIAFYIFVHVSLLVVPVAFATSEVPRISQIAILERDFPSLVPWLSSSNPWAVYDGGVNRIPFLVIIYGIIINYCVLGSLLLFCLIDTLRIVRRTRSLVSTTTRQHAAKVKNTNTVVIQLLNTLFFNTIPIGIFVFSLLMDENNQKAVVVAECLLATGSLSNSLIFIYGNRQYVAVLSSLFHGQSKERTPSIVLQPAFKF